MRIPLIGVPIGSVLEQDRLPHYGLNRQYVVALREVGAEVVLLPAGGAPAAGVLERLDGLLFPGGLDVHPSNYGEPPSDMLGRVDRDLDSLELSLVRSAVELGLPVLGICRGQQVVNVALGGSLYQDIRGCSLSGLDHWAPSELGRDHLHHWVRLRSGTLLRTLVGAASIRVNSFHHQAVKVPAPGLRVNATAEDGVIEGLESEDGKILTLQCHPEALIARHRWARVIFSAFVEAAARRSGISVLALTSIAAF